MILLLMLIFFTKQLTVHVSGFSAKDLSVAIPITIGSVPYQPPCLPPQVEPSAPPLTPPQYNEGIEPYPGAGKYTYK